jgi:phosphodiesterase/alkaline phosphatase D-like protein
VITTDATNVTSTSARLNGDLLTKGTANPVDVSFVYGTTSENYTYETTPPEARTDLGSFYFDLGSLTPKTTYYYKAKAVGDGTDLGDEKSFTTSPIPPTVTTNEASLVTTTSARLNGDLTSLGAADNATVSFEWGTTDGGPWPNSTDNQTMTSAGAFTANLTGLTPGTTYYFRAKAVGDMDTVPFYGVEKSFTASTTPPTATTSDATSVATTSATLNGNLTSLGTATSVTVSFVWGTTAGGPYTLEATGQAKAATGAFSADLSGLTPGTSYYYKAKAVGADTVYGAEKSFTASTTPPTATTSNAASIATTSATLNGNLTFLGTATSVTISFVWGTTTSYGNATTPEAKTATGAFSANLTGLTANTTYHFRANAVGHGSAVYGEDMTFTTASLADTAVPVISVVNSSDITVSKATITWTTNEAATSQVQYGLTEEYGSSTTPDTNLVNTHSVDLTGLKAGKTYHYRVISKDAASNQALSEDYTFTTDARSGGMPVWAWVLIGLAAVGIVGAAAFLIRGRLAKQ